MATRSQTLPLPKTGNVENRSKMRPERLGTPFKSRGMQNYVGLYRNYVFPRSVVPVFAQKTLEKWQKQKPSTKTPKMRPERLGTPFKRRAMENYVGLYSIYIFTSSVARAFVEKHWKIGIIRQTVGKVLKNV